MKGEKERRGMERRKLGRWRKGKEMKRETEKTERRGESEKERRGR
jgi:hypothetical protein